MTNMATPLRAQRLVFPDEVTTTGLGMWDFLKNGSEVGDNALDGRAL